MPRAFFRRALRPLGLVAVVVLSTICPATAQMENFGQNKVQYRTFDWNYITSEHFDIYFYEGGYDLARFSAAVLESAYVQVSGELDHRVRKRVPVIIYQSHNEFQQTNVTGGLLEEGVGGFTESFKNRMVMPFTGSYEDFRHVLHHELTHAVTFDKLYGDGVGSLLSSRSFFSLPLWFAEGFAEYSSRYGWDTFADMVIRDATVHGYLQPLEWVGGYLAYKEGQSAILYMAERYGEEKISEVLSKGRFELSLDNSLKKAIGMGVKEFDEAWQKRLRKEYWPEISEREEPKDFAKQLTDHEKDGSYYNDKPVFSPRGDRLAIFSERADYTEVKVISAVDGQRLKRVLKGGASDRFESLHSFLSGMSFSPDGSMLALVAKSRGEDALFLLPVDGHGRQRILRLGFSALRSPVFAPDGNSIVLVGCRQGTNDLYRVDLHTSDVTRLTDDRYDEQDPEFDPSGTKLLFACDRPADGPSPLWLSGTQDPQRFSYGDYNIFEADLTSGTVRPLTADSAENKTPVYAPDGQRICYVSNKNGIYNLYLIDSGETRSYPITDALSGCFSPTWSPDGRNIAFTAFFRGGFDVFLIKDIRPKGDSTGALTLTSYMRRVRGLDSTSYVTRHGIELEERVPKVLDEDLEFTSYVKPAETPYQKKPLVTDSSAADTAATAGRAAGTTPDSGTVAVRDTMAVAVADTSHPGGPRQARAVEDDSTGFAVHKYHAKFTPDLVTGGLGYDTFYGLRGQSFFVISDYMGDHQFLIASDLINTIDQANIQVFYIYQPRRVDIGLGLFHSKYYYVDFTDRLFSDRTYGIQALASRPFSRFTRLELDGLLAFIDRRYYDPDELGRYDDRSDRVGLGALSLVHDNAGWGLTGPVSGRRYRLTVEYAPGGLSEGIAYQALTADLRQYTRLTGRYGFAWRLGAGISGGDTPKRFYLGGVSNWIGSRIAESGVYDVEGLYFSEVITPFRGYDYYAISGTKYAVFNAEFRFPFVDQLALRFPLPLVFSRIGGVLFADAGSAWSHDREFQGASSQGGFHLQDIHSSFGYGMRANLGIVVLRFDQAWRTDLRDVAAHPVSYFSLGADF
ncbi:MAG: BamA/TamA family outer membrane protein [Candidatus Zixiibacteriota bacterium]